MATPRTDRLVRTQPAPEPSAPPWRAGRSVARVVTRAMRPLRAVARSAIFLLKVFPMLPSRPVDWVTRPPVVERVRYPTRYGWTEGDLYRPASGGAHPGLLVCLGVAPARGHRPARREASMNDRTLYRLTGWFGLAMVVLWLSQFPLYMQGDASISVYDGAALGRSLFRIHNIVFTRILLDLGLYIAGMVFAAGIRDLIRRARPDHEWCFGGRVNGSAG